MSFVKVAANSRKIADLSKSKKLGIVVFVGISTPLSLISLGRRKSESEVNNLNVYLIRCMILCRQSYTNDKVDRINLTLTF